MMWMMGFWMIGPLVLVGALVYALAARPRSERGTSTRDGQSPQDIVRERYARGELSPAEYEQVVRDLQS